MGVDGGMSAKSQVNGRLHDINDIHLLTLQIEEFSDLRSSLQHVVRSREPARALRLSQTRYQQIDNECSDQAVLGKQTVYLSHPICLNCTVNLAVHKGRTEQIWRCFETAAATAAGPESTETQGLRKDEECLKRRVRNER